MAPVSREDPSEVHAFKPYHIATRLVGRHLRASKSSPQQDMSSSSRAGMAVGVQDKKLFPLFSRQPSKQAQRGEAEQVPAAASGSESVAQASASGQTRPTSAHKAEASSIEAGPSLPSSRSMDGHDGRMSQDSLQKARAASSTPINASSARLRSRTPPVKPKPPRPAEVIEIPDSPDKEASPKLKTLADFAAERKAKAKARKPIIQQEPLWPSSTTIHVRAVRNEPLQMSSVPPFDYKGKGRALDLDDHQLAISYGSSYVPPALLSIMHNPSSTSIEAANSKQARTAIPADSGGPATTEVWPVHYAPKRCDDVLGAQAKSNTQYLRTWLEALSVEGKQSCLSDGRAQDGLHSHVAQTLDRGGGMPQVHDLQSVKSGVR